MSRVFVRLLAVLLIGGWVAAPLMTAPANADPADDSAFSYIVSVENKTFYPLVKDGYRDTTKVSIDHNLEYWRIRANVYNANNRNIRQLRVIHKTSRDWTYDWSEAHWNGKKDDGTLARKGQYRIEITAVFEEYDEEQDDWVEVPVTANRTVTIEGGYMDRRLFKTKRGIDTSSRSHGRGCYTDTYRRYLELACWDGTYAKATWRFKIPANAKNVRKALYGPSGWDHGGKLVMTGKRVNATTYVITAKITKWKQEWFHPIEVRYTSRVRV